MPMTFIWPAMLVSLLLVPLLVALYIWLQGRRRRLAATIGGLGFVQGTGGKQLGARRHIPPGLFLAGLAVMLVALARPQTLVSLPSMESTVILAFDVSGSMAADDMEPTRMEAAKTAAREFVERQPANVQIGVVAFSDDGIAVQPPTNDQAAILASIDRLSPQRGTSLARGILASLDVIAGDSGQAGESDTNPTPVPTPTPVPYGTYIPAVIVLLTDGENTVSIDPLAAAQAAADRGVRLYTIGVGSPAGATLEINGFMVHTQLDEATLQQLSKLTEGAYFKAESEEDLRSIYEQLDPELVVKPEKMEVTSLFAGVSLLVLLFGAAFSLLWNSRIP